MHSRTSRKILGRPLEKNPPRRRTIVFVDETGVSERPHCCRTWTLRGQTPIVHYIFNWNPVVSESGLTFEDLYFRLYQGTIGSDQVVEFLNGPRCAGRHAPFR